MNDVENLQQAIYQEPIFVKGIYSIIDKATESVQDTFVAVSQAVALRRIEAFFMGCPYDMNDYRLVVHGCVNQKTGKIELLSDMVEVDISSVIRRVEAMRKSYMNEDK